VLRREAENQKKEECDCTNESALARRLRGVVTILIPKPRLSAVRQVTGSNLPRPARSREKWTRQAAFNAVIGIAITASFLIEPAGPSQGGRLDSRFTWPREWPGAAGPFWLLYR
jgi:hypothetical protein